MVGGNRCSAGACDPVQRRNAVLHPHVGTMVENGYEVQRVLDSSSVALCLDTGHLLIGGRTRPSWPGRCPAASRTRI